MSSAERPGDAVPARVLVVDDSAFARKVLREVLGRAEGLEVVGIARDGLEALEKVHELRPDVVTLDLVMPGLDGLGFLDALQGSGASPVPRVVVVSVSGQDSELGLEALGRGAVELVLARIVGAPIDGDETLTGRWGDGQSAVLAGLRLRRLVV